MYGWENEGAVEKARAQVAKLINADPKEIIFTSGGLLSLVLFFFKADFGSFLSD